MIALRTTGDSAELQHRAVAFRHIFDGALNRVDVVCSLQCCYVVPFVLLCLLAC